MYNFERSENGSPSDNDIYDIVIECSNLFETLTLFGNDGHNKDQSATASYLQPGENDATRRTKIEQLGRSFDLWINYTGALASIGRSLDNRLRDHPDIKEMVMDLLEVLHKNLCHIRNSNIIKPSAERQDLDKEAWRAIDASIDDLHFMAAAIRRASNQSQKYALSSRFEQNEEIYFENYATLLARREFPNARRSLCEHLGASIAVRRQRIFRKKMHEEKLGKRREITALTPEPGINEQHRIVKAPQTHTRVQSRIQPLVLQILEKKHNIASGSHESRSELQSTVARNYLKHGPSLSTISSGSSIQIAAIGYPQKPKPSLGDKYCACPYCAKPLDSDRLRNDTTYWENHLDIDIQPYVCLSEDCTSPFSFFANMSHWLDHMDTIHSEEWNRKIHMGTWYCDVDHGGQVYQFNDYVDFVAHMKDGKSHPGRTSPTESQIDSMSRKMQKMLTRDDLYTCPLCDCVPASIMPILQTSYHKDIKQLLVKHIAQHVKAFTFVLVPIFTSEEDDARLSMTSDGNDEKRRLRREESKASYPSDLDDLRARKINDVDESYNLEGEDPLSQVIVYPDTSESIWNDIGFDDFNHARLLSIREKQDPILNQLSRLQSVNSPEQLGGQDSRLNLDVIQQHDSRTIDGTVEENTGHITFPERQKKQDNEVSRGPRQGDVEKDLKPQPSEEVFQQRDDAEIRSKTSKDGENKGEAMHFTQNLRQKLAPESSSSAAGTYEDLGLGNASSSFLGAIFNRVRGQPESYKKKSKYRFGRTLFDSKNAIVREAEGPSGLVSIKTIVKTAKKSAEQAAYNEINTLRRLDHHHIIHLIDWFESRDKYYIVMQHTGGGDLFDRICDRGKLLEEEAMSTVYQVLHAVSYLHTNLIVHLNIKPENIRYATIDDDSPVILVGFGHSVILSSAEEVLTGVVGTFGYAAPEVMENAGYNRAADVWSIGVVTYTMLCGYSPFRSENIQDLIDECAQGSIIFHERYWKDISQDAKDFTSNLLVYSPKDRFACQDALAHSWITRSPRWQTDMHIIMQAANIRVKLRHAIRVVMLRNQYNHLYQLRADDDSTSEFDRSQERYGMFRAVVRAVLHEREDAEFLRQLLEAAPREGAPSEIDNAV